MDVILYSRVSTELQSKNGFSLPEQERSLRQYAERNKWNVIGHYQDEYSAKDFNRPEFQHFLNDVKSGKIKPQILLCVRIDRFSRNLQDSLEMQAMLNKMGIEIKFADRDYDTGNPEDLLMKVIDMTLAEVFNTRLAKNTIKGMREATRLGRWMGKAPYGYINNKETKLIEIHSVTSLIVIEAFELMATGTFTAEEVRLLLKKKGLKIGKNQFLNLLRNKFYIGIIELKEYKDEPAMTIQGLHEPLISEQLFNRVQWVFASRKRASGLNKARREELPLRGFLVCPNCRRLLTGSASKSRNKQLHLYYHCQKKYNCDHRVRASLIHDKLEEYLGSFKIMTEVKRLYRVILEKKFGSFESQRTSDLQNLQKEMTRIQSNLESLNFKFIENMIDPETYASMKRKYDEQIQKIKSEEELLSSQDTEYARYISRGFTLIDNLKAFYQQASVEVKQKIVGSIFPQNLTLDKNEYRTSPVNEAFRLITRVISELQEAKKQNATQMDGILNLAPPPGLEPGTP